MSENPFETAEAWGVGGGGFTPGAHRVTIDSASDGTSSGNYPQVILEMSNDMDSIRDYVTVTPRTVGKVAQLADAAGVARPAPGEFDPQSLRLTGEYIKRFEGKQVMIVVELEDDRKGDTDAAGRVKQWPRVQGYRSLDELPTGPVPPAADSSGAADNRIPF